MKSYDNVVPSRLWQILQLREVQVLFVEAVNGSMETASDKLGRGNRRDIQHIGGSESGKSNFSNVIQYPHGLR